MAATCWVVSIRSTGIFGISMLAGGGVGVRVSGVVLLSIWSISPIALRQSETTFVAVVIISANPPVPKSARRRREKPVFSAPRTSPQGPESAAWETPAQSAVASKSSSVLRKFADSRAYGVSAWSSELALRPGCLGLWQRIANSTVSPRPSGLTRSSSNSILSEAYRQSLAVNY